MLQYVNTKLKLKLSTSSVLEDNKARSNCVSKCSYVVSTTGEEIVIDLSHSLEEKGRKRFGY